MEFLFNNKALAKVTAAAGYTKETLEYFSKGPSVFEAYSYFYDAAFQNMLIGNFSVAQLQFDFISNIELRGKLLAEKTDPWELVIMKKQMSDLFSEIDRLIENACLLKDTVGTQYMEYTIVLFSLKEALNELRVNQLYTADFLVRYVDLIKKEIRMVSKTILDSLVDDGEMEMYDRMMALMEA